MQSSLNFPYTLAHVWFTEVQENEKIHIISKTAQVVVKLFWPRTNIPNMFLFPWLYRGQPISDFEKIDIFCVTLYFQPLLKAP